MIVIWPHPKCLPFFLSLALMTLYKPPQAFCLAVFSPSLSIYSICDGSFLLGSPEDSESFSLLERTGGGGSG